MSRDVRFFILLVLLMLLTGVVACGKDGLKPAEYFVNEEWRQCSIASEEACGATLVCGEDVFLCMTNLQRR